MPRTFSLARLMLGITLIGFACGGAVNFPYDHWLEFFLLLPTLVAGLFFSYLGKRHGLSFGFSFGLASLGYLYGFVFWSVFEESFIWWAQRGLNRQAVSSLAGLVRLVLPGVFAMLATIGYLWVELLLRKLKHQQPQIDPLPPQPLK